MTTYDTKGSTDPRAVRVGIGEYALSTDGAVLETSGLGSCVAVALHDGEAGVTGLVHVMLPTAEGNDGRDPATFADEGVEALVEAMEAAGAERDRLCAKIAGGSEMLDFSGLEGGVGERNVETVRETLEAIDVPLLASDVGGSHGRSLTLAPDGTLEVHTADGDDHAL